MKNEKWTKMITNFEDKNEQIEAAIVTKDLEINDQMVSVLCDVAVETIEADVRFAILDILKVKDFEKAADRFAYYCMNGTDRQRRWAFVNLSLIGCHSKKEVVLKGLKDCIPAVQRAAAMNAGLYQNDDFLKAITFYFENNECAFLQESFLRLSERIFCIFQDLKSKIPSAYQRKEEKFGSISK